MTMGPAASDNGSRTPQEVAMIGKVGDMIVIESEKVGKAERRGEILEIIPHDPHPEYRVRWDDGRETSIRPHAGSVRIESPKATTKT
jgi:hypothetical protein